MEKKITISDIARTAGVSKTTISRYLNGHYEYMSAETREKIEKIITLFNYSPNNLARGLKSKRSGLIGIVANTLQYQVAALFVRGIHDVCVANNYGTIICCSDNILAQETEALKMCVSQQADGIAIIPVNMDCSYYHQIHENGIPIVMCNRYRENWKYDGVYVDNVALTRQALSYMFDNGYTALGMITDNEFKESNKTFREEAFVEFCEQHCGGGKDQLYPVQQDPQKVKAAILDFIKKYPDKRKALFVINTNTLFITLREIKSLGLRIPEDIGICGYDLLGWTELVPPGITALHQPFYELGVEAGHKLIRRINNPLATQPDETWFNGSISYRDSTKKF